MLEATCYRTPTGILMVVCPCRVKARVLKDGNLATHYAFDKDYADEDCPEGYCVHSGAKFTLAEGEVFGMEFGIIG